ncbi:alanine racemase [Ruegeria arenilitoris]|uniref:alanine racemase n=1 Tax=Ruegeria arenilitoris TaxID=1173585 RepID=UPI00147A0B39|nr:alanine racemase [Ruegeria arenilitoris]
MSEYLQNLSETLRAYGVDKPVAVIDLDRLEANCALAVSGADAGFDCRLVAKSLPCLPLLNHIRGRISTSGLMTFSEPMLRALLQAEPKTDHLMGKPLPVSSVARVLSECPDASARVQWLVDSPERLQAYLALAAGRQSVLRLSLEVDTGLHRGGFQPEHVAEIAQEIDANPNARLSGVMGYEVHLAKLPGFLRKRAVRACADAFDLAVSGLPNRGKGLCLNTGGSLTFQSYRAGDNATEIAFGSVLVKPTDFEHATTQRFQPAGFIASPVLKTMPGNPLPGLNFLARRKTDLAIFGGYFPAKPVFPYGFGYSSIFGRSSNQEVWTGPQAATVKPGDIALLRPSQSEAVLNQFGVILAVRGEQVVAEWECLPN